VRLPWAVVALAVQDQAVGGLVVQKIAQGLALEAQ
jgi:hypothetical protein